MIKKINMGNGQSVELNSSAGWLYCYREQFGRDILPDLMPMLESLLGFGVKVFAGGNKEVNVADLIASVDDETMSDLAINFSSFETLTILNIIWSMAKKANPDIDPPEEFFDQFDCVPFDTVVPTVIKMVINSSVSSKNAKSLLAVMKKTGRESPSKISRSQASSAD